MKHIVYPAVLEIEEQSNTFCFNFQDLNVVTVGNSVENAFIRACSDFQAYIDFSLKFDFQLPEPTEFEVFVGLNPKKHVMLFKALVQDEKVMLDRDDKEYKRIIESMIE